MFDTTHRSNPNKVLSSDGPGLPDLRRVTDTVTMRESQRWVKPQREHCTSAVVSRLPSVDVDEFPTLVRWRWMDAAPPSNRKLTVKNSWTDNFRLYVRYHKTVTHCELRSFLHTLFFQVRWDECSEAESHGQRQTEGGKKKHPGRGPWAGPRQQGNK